MEYKRKINPNSLANLVPDNRKQSDTPKKRVNITIDKEVLYILKQTGNVSGAIEALVVERVNQENTEKKIAEICEKIDNKDNGYKSNSASKLIKDVKQLEIDYTLPDIYLIR